MDDLISRQAAIDEAEEWIKTYNSERGGQRERDAIKHVISGIKKLPSAQPQRKGKWIDVTKTGGAELWKCSECGELELEDSYFCPNCGAWMSEESEPEHTMDEFMHGQDLGSPEDGSL